MIIGLTGYAQSGKDSVADILVKNYGYTRIAFADPIRKLLYETNPAVKDGDYRLQGVELPESKIQIVESSSSLWQTMKGA